MILWLFYNAYRSKGRNHTQNGYRRLCFIQTINDGRILGQMYSLKLGQRDGVSVIEAGGRLKIPLKYLPLLLGSFIQASSKW